MSESDNYPPNRSSQLFGNPFFWLAVTLVLVGLAYIWMDQVKKDLPVVAIRKILPEQSLSQYSPGEAAEKQESLPITRETDAERAEAYRAVVAREQALEPLFESARNNMEYGNYVLPGEDNAWLDYQQVLQISAENRKAENGLIKIRNLLIDNAETAIEIGDFGDAENWLVQLDVIQPGDPLQEELRDDIRRQIALEAEARLRAQAEQEKQEKIETALRQARDEGANNPINYNKIKDLYNRVIELDPANEQAANGLERLADALFDRTETALQNNELALASRQLAEARQVNPDSNRINGLKLALESKLAQQAQQQRMNEIEQVSQQNSTSIAAQSDQNGESVRDTAETQTANTENPVPSAAVGEDATVTDDERPDRLERGIRAYYEGDYNTSFELLYPLAEEGLARAQFRIGVMYRYGRSVSQNADLSEKWFTQALPVILRLAQEGAAWAQTDLGTAYELGISLQQDFERAAHWYQQAADQGYPGAQTNLGVLYANGDGVDYNRSQAVFWLKQAASQGDMVALENLKILGEPVAN